MPANVADDISVDVRPLCDAPSSSPATAAPNRRRIAANFLAQAVTSVSGLVITILISMYVRRALGPTAIGQFGWAQAAIAYLSILANLGLATIGQRELAKHPDRARELIALILTLQTALAAFVYACVLVIAAVEPRGKTVSILLLIQGLTLFLTAWNTGWVLQARERMVAASIAGLVFNALQLPALLLLVHEPDDLILYAILGLPFALLGVAYNLWHIHRHRLAAALWSLRPSLTGAKALLREAWPLALVQAAVLTNFNGATIILGFADEDDAVGQYVTGLRLMMVAAVVTAAMWNAYFPAFARVQGSPTQAVSLSREYLGLLAWIGLPAAALGWATGRHIVDLMYGIAFAASGRYFEWLCLFIGLNFLNYGFSGIFVPWGYNRLGLKVSGFSAIINVAACLLTIPSYGAWGAIFAMIASEFAIMVLGLAYRWQQQIFWHPILPIVVPPLLCSSAVALAIAAAPSSFDRYWWLQLLAGAVVLAACAAGFQRRVLLNLVRFILRRGGTTSAEAIRS